MSYIRVVDFFDIVGKGTAFLGEASDAFSINDKIYLITSKGTKCTELHSIEKVGGPVDKCDSNDDVGMVLNIKSDFSIQELYVVVNETNESFIQAFITNDESEIPALKKALLSAQEILDSFVSDVNEHISEHLEFLAKKYRQLTFINESNEIEDTSFRNESKKVINKKLGYTGKRLDYFVGYLTDVIQKTCSTNENGYGESFSMSTQKNEDVVSKSMNSEPDDFLDNLSLNESFDDPAYEIIQQAEDYYYGLGDCQQDYGEAFRLFNQAAKIGSPKALNMLGKMLCHGIGCTKNINKAIDCFKDSCRRGYHESYAEMGILFSQEDHIENSRKCWKRYFESQLFESDNNSKFFEERLDNILYRKASNACFYLQAVYYEKLPFENKEKLLRIKDAIILLHENAISYFQKNGDSEAIERRTKEMLFAKKILN